jgi:transcriptional regulator with XRE-family HTH domain
LFYLQRLWYNQKEYSIGVSMLTSFGDYLRDLRQQNDLTQETLAERVGCAVQTLRAYEQGRRRPSREMAERLAHVLGVPADQIAAFVRLARITDTPPITAAAEHPVAHQPPVQTATPQELMPRHIPFMDTIPIIGRQAELVQLLERLADPACRLLTIVGPGGIGKTTLAMAAAKRLAASFQDGIHVLELAGTQELNESLVWLTTTLGITTANIERNPKLIIAALRDRHFLV